MALVPFQPTTTASARVDSDYRDIRHKLESLMSEQRDKVYLGLGNQGATCYMNSLLQALFMTPEVRNQIYAYAPFAESNPQFNIPLQLQKLFARL